MRSHERRCLNGQPGDLGCLGASVEFADCAEQVFTFVYVHTCN